MRKDVALAIILWMAALMLAGRGIGLVTMRQLTLKGGQVC